MLALSEQASARGLSCVVTTTTKIWPPPSMPLVVEADGTDVIDSVRVKLQQAPCVAVGGHLADSGKLIGLRTNHVCKLAGSGVADVVLCEADGAAGRSLKVHGPGEPVVPGCATSVTIVAGLDAIGRMPGPDVVHRFECFLALPEFDSTGAIDASTCARVLLRAAKLLDPEVPVAFILNKADDDEARHDAYDVAGALAVQMSHCTVVMSSHHLCRGRGPTLAQRVAHEPDVHAAL